MTAHLGVVRAGARVLAPVRGRVLRVDHLEVLVRDDRGGVHQLHPDAVRCTRTVEGDGLRRCVCGEWRHPARCPACDARAADRARTAELTA